MPRPSAETRTGAREPLALVEPKLRGRIDHRVGGSSVALGVMDDQVGEPDRRRVPARLAVCGVARRRRRRPAGSPSGEPAPRRPGHGRSQARGARSAPAPRAPSSGVQPLELPVHLRQHEMPEVVNEGRDRQLVTLPEVAPARRSGRRHGGWPPRVAGTARAVPPRGPANRTGRRCRSRRRPRARPVRQRLDRLPHAAVLPCRRGVARRAHDGDRQRDVRLDRLGELAGRCALALGSAEAGAGGTRRARAAATRRRTPWPGGDRPVRLRARCRGRLGRGAVRLRRLGLRALGVSLLARGLAGGASRPSSAALARAAAWWRPESWASLPVSMIGTAATHV